MTKYSSVASGIGEHSGGRRTGVRFGEAGPLGLSLGLSASSAEKWLSGSVLDHGGGYPFHREV